MRLLRIAPIFAAAVAAAGCFQMATVIHVKGDGTGTIDQRLVFTQAALDRLKQLAFLDGNQTFNPLSEEQARADAVTLGPGVTLVSSTPINDETGQGRASVFAFTDITQLRVSQQPGLASGVHIQNSTAPEAVRVNLMKQPNGNALLTIDVPQPALPGAARSEGASAPAPDQLAMLKQMFAGARVSMVVEPVGTLVRTNSAYVDGQRVTLLDLSLDDLLRDDTLFGKMQAAKSPDEMRAALERTPGLKINVDREIAIEFTPAK